MAEPRSFTKQYLGDGLYIDFDGLQFVVSAENGVDVTNRIYIEATVWHSMKRVIEQSGIPGFEEKQ